MSANKIFAKGVSIAGVLTAIAFFVFPYLTSRNLFYAAINVRYFFLLIFIYIMIGVWLYHVYNNGLRISWRGRWLAGLLILTGAIYLLASIVGIHPGQSFWSDIIRSTGTIFVFHIGLLMFLLSEMLTKKDWLWIRRAFIGGSALFSLFYFLGKEGLKISGRFLTVNFELAGLSFGNQTFAAAYILIPILLTFMELRNTRRWSRAFWFWIVALLLQMLSPLFVHFNALVGRIPFKEIVSDPSLLIGSARASAITLGLVVIYFIGRAIVRFIFKKDSNLRSIASKTYAAVFGVAVLAMVIMLFIPGTRIQNAYINESTAARTFVWHAGWESVADRPVLGWGPENFEFGFWRYFDNRLYLRENYGEIWFDRAHNLFVDTAINAGIIGLLAFLAIAVYTIYIYHRAYKRGKISGTEAHILGVVIVAHLFQLQTSFEVIGTYFAWVFMLGYAMWLEREMNKEKEAIEVFPAKDETGSSLTIAGGVVVLIIAAIFFVGKPFNQQHSIVSVFRTLDADVRLEAIKKATTQKSSFESISTLNAALIAGATANPNLLTNQELTESVRKENALYIDLFSQYVERNPLDYRARMNLAQAMYFSTILGTPKIEEARAIVQDSYELAPANPLTYVLDAASYMYEGDFSKAFEIVDAGVALNPDIEFTQLVREFMLNQQAQFPNITFLNLENI